ncbi:MAG: tRNA (adenine-N(1)-)-methyltransferase catalytic subunit trm61 [Phylliscum demangeonii]|nr:MAG: tRNA (adenine-N(1)-)-methyltransferase catalytic subunit trm61 [Phylliscum demangeonii]
MATPQTSPFLSPGSVSKAESWAMLHLRRDQVRPTKLTHEAAQSDGYKEGPVTNTRFGSFPHSTLVGLPWGSQVRASVVDTGSRGRRATDALESGRQKRKRENADSDLAGQEISTPDQDEDAPFSATPLTASSGFIHLLPPTVELWTTSLPHRTQVVYTPDYSYILHRLRARPGSVLIEAGAGSGSFSHAAARAVFNGYPPPSSNGAEVKGQEKRYGQIWSYEFHEQRVERLKTEIQEHGLADIIHITHRDVYEDGFLQDAHTSVEPRADAIFLDLPAPWLALPHLTRRSAGRPSSVENGMANGVIARSPLNPDSAVHICTFSPCIEQAQRTIAALREMGWVDAEMVTVAQKRIEVRRERIGLQGEGQRGCNASPATVEEAFERLKWIGGRAKRFHARTQARNNSKKDDVVVVEGSPPGEKEPALNMMEESPPVEKEPSLKMIEESAPVESEPALKMMESQATTSRKLFKEGRLVHRAEPELKAHTAYLVFAVLPRDWTATDEEAAARNWPFKRDQGTANARNDATISEHVA